MAPKPEATTNVLQWLSEHGIDGTTKGAYENWIHISLSVSQANQLLGAKFANYVYTPTGAEMTRTLSYQLPQDLFQYIDVVYPTTSFDPLLGRDPLFSIPVAKKEKREKLRYYREISPDCNTEVTPTCLQELYGIPTKPATQSSNKLAVSGFLNQFAQKADLKSFLKQFRPDISPKTSFHLQKVDGGENLQGVENAGLEANLDIQYTVGLAADVPVVFVSVGNQTTDGAQGFLDIILHLAQSKKPPQVLTTSYGFNELALSPQLETKMCDAYMALGARGVSILFAAGDGGASGFQSQQCTSFVPTFPSTCPYLTSVGATQGVSPEIAASLSSGGFSNVFGQPSY